MGVVARVLSSLVALQELHIVRALSITDEAFWVTHLQGWNKFGDAGATALADALVSTASLVALDVVCESSPDLVLTLQNNNRMGVAGASALGRTIGALHSLRYLNLVPSVCLRGGDSAELQRPQS